MTTVFSKVIHSFDILCYALCHSVGKYAYLDTVSVCLCERAPLAAVCTAACCRLP